jgi:hypothetical protein
MTGLGTITNMVGVIPSFDRRIDFGFEWDNCLTPLEHDYTLLERSVMECATVGCSSIWICCDPHMIPLTKERIGEVALDPVWAKRPFEKEGWKLKRYIPIFYVPINSMHINKMESVAWQIIWAAHSSYYVSKFISKWTTYDKVYVSSPFGVYGFEALREKREIIRKNNVFLQYSNKDATHDMPLGFCFTAEDFIESRRNLRRLFTEKGKEIYEEGTKWVFDNIKNKDYEIITLEEFYPLRTFQDLRNYYGSSLTFDYKKKNWLIPKVWFDRTSTKENENE